MLLSNAYLGFGGGGPSRIFIGAVQKNYNFEENFYSAFDCGLTISQWEGIWEINIIGFIIDYNAYQIWWGSA